jgi:hypothetical protein
LGSVFPFPGEFEGLLGWACCVDCSAVAHGEGAQSQIGRVWGGWAWGLEVVGLVWEMVMSPFWRKVMYDGNDMLCFDVCWFGVWIGLLSRLGRVSFLIVPILNHCR